MKKLFFSLVGCLLAFAANATTFYLVGSGTVDGKALPGSPNGNCLAVESVGSTLTFTVENVSWLKISDNNASGWDDFNKHGFTINGKGDYAFKAADLGQPFNLWWGNGTSAAANNLNPPGTGKYTYTINFTTPGTSTSTIVVTADSDTKEEVHIYLRGNGNWDTCNSSNEFTTTDGNIFKISVPSLSSAFKIADANWGSINYGSNNAVPFGVATKLTYNANDISVTGMPIANATLTFNLSDETLLVEGNAGGDITKPDYSSWYVNVIGPFNNWGDNGVQPVNGISTTSNLKIGTEGFKIKVWNGEDIYYISDGQAIPTDEWVTLYQDTSSGPAILIEGATAGSVYTVKFNCETNEVYVTEDEGQEEKPFEMPEKLYLLGNVNGLNWSTSQGVEATNADGIFKWEGVTVEPGDDGNCYVNMATVLGASWEVVNSGDRFGAESSNTPLKSGETATIVRYPANVSASGCQSWMIPAGFYNFTANLNDNTLKLEEVVEPDAATIYAHIYNDALLTESKNPITPSSSDIAFVYDETAGAYVATVELAKLAKNYDMVKLYSVEDGTVTYYGETSQYGGTYVDLSFNEVGATVSSNGIAASADPAQVGIFYLFKLPNGTTNGKIQISLNEDLNSATFTLVDAWTPEKEPELWLMGIEGAYAKGTKMTRSTADPNVFEIVFDVPEVKEEEDGELGHDAGFIFWFAPENSATASVKYVPADENETIEFTGDVNKFESTWKAGKISDPGAVDLTPGKTKFSFNINDYKFVAEYLEDVEIPGGDLKVYVVGNGDGMTWDLPGQEFSGSNGVVSFSLKNVSKFKVSVNNATNWDEFNAGSYGTGSASFGKSVYPDGQTLPMEIWGEDQELPWTGDYTITLDFNNETIKAVATTAAPTDAPDVYVRGDMNNWLDSGLDDAWKFTNVSWDATTSTGEYRINCSIPAGQAFKIADANWGSINYGGVQGIAANTEVELVYNSGTNLTLAAGFEGTIIFKVTADKQTATIYFEQQGEVKDPENFYVIGTLAIGSWNPTVGVKMVGNGTGIYTADEVVLEENGGSCGFAIVANLGANEDDWGTVNALRFGPAVQDSEASIGENTGLTNGDLSWTIEPGTYKMVFDYKNLTLTISETESNVIENIATDDTEAVYFNLQGVRVANPDRGIYIRVAGDKVEKVVK